MNYYFHWPFCRSKCGYCAFYSEVPRSPARVEACLDRFETELAAGGWEPATTIYLGGGTPTLPDCRTLERWFGMIRSALHPVSGCEISIEANPETLDAGKVELLRSFATRISLGVQSFDPVVRRRLGRDCSQAALDRALKLVAAAEFEHWNLDLIYAVPGQSTAAWRRELEVAAALPVDHLSCYSLTPEEGARLAGSFMIDDVVSGEMFLLAGEVLAAAGFPRYEVSNYARPGAECRHNLAVWRGGKLKGFGPSAAGFDGRDRYSEPAALDRWLAGAPGERDVISATARLNEIFAVNLRTAVGWTPGLWRMVPGADAWPARLARTAAAVRGLPDDWLVLTPEAVRLTADGMLFWDTVAQALI